jgi:hypothetical protein
MSALPPEADMLIVGINVCYVPIADLYDAAPDHDRKVGKPDREHHVFLPGRT